ncbi:hypothetical protein MVI01_32700 [Myxococcus virescens]|uniref:Uncharacterized protein n=1 Tax=Myxococcus virescens TaxID=83456 RepID=A0A511HD61_9BACT|nr:hypothetical protein MVI01_32700 [Myxococcus virescens]
MAATPRRPHVPPSTPCKETGAIMRAPGRMLQDSEASASFGGGRRFGAEEVGKGSTPRFAEQLWRDGLCPARRRPNLSCP